MKARSSAARKMFGTLGRQNLFALAFRTNTMRAPVGRAKKIAALVAMLAVGRPSCWNGGAELGWGNPMKCLQTQWQQPRADQNTCRLYQEAHAPSQLNAPARPRFGEARCALSFLWRSRILFRIRKR